MLDRVSRGTGFQPVLKPPPDEGTGFAASLLPVPTSMVSKPMLGEGFKIRLSARAHIAANGSSQRCGTLRPPEPPPATLPLTSVSVLTGYPFTLARFGRDLRKVWP